MSVPIDSQTKAIVWTAKVSARNLRGYVQRLTDCPQSKVENLLRLISSEAEILSKAAQKIGTIDLPSENRPDDAPPEGDCVLVLAKVLNAIAAGVMTKCARCGKFVDGGGGHERVENGPAQPDDNAKIRARQAAQENQ